MTREEQLQRESEVYAWTANQFDIELAFKKGAEWELWREQQVESYGDRYKVFHFVCKKCGKFKRVKSS